MIFIAGFLLVVYVVLILLYAIGFWRQKSFDIPDNFIPKTKISVIVAARNECSNIENCVQSILAQNYPSHLFELIIVDDFSTDNTVELVHKYSSPNLKVLLLSENVTKQERLVSYKKKALSVGISHSTGDLLVTTDADCWMEKDWLMQIAALYEVSGAQMIVAPVRFVTNSSVLQMFQSLDFMTMQGITVATVRLKLGIMCNGANLAFTKRSYLDVNGYDGVDQLISGDDYLLMMKIKKHFPDGIRYLKSKGAIVNTLPQLTWNDFLQQRIRWASKTGKYDDPKTSLILLFVYLFNCSCFVLALLSIFNTDYLYVTLLFLVVKIVVELLFLQPVAQFFSQSRNLVFFPFLQPIHILYIIVAGFLSRIGKFDWKNRNSIHITNQNKT
jgi:glycosyltransferase involved in cell wall biosynthesis